MTRKENNDKGYFKREISIAVISGLIVAGACQLPAIIGKLDTIPKDLENIQSDLGEQSDNINNLQNELGSLKNDVVALQTIHKMYSGEVAERPKDGLPDDMKYAIPVEADGKLANLVKKETFEVFDEYNLAAPAWASTDVIAIGIDGTEYTTEDLYNKKVILSYDEGEQEVFFTGQFNEKNQWDGNCLINVYKNGILVIATEAEYNNGVRTKYEQVFPNQNAWVYSRRIEEDGRSSGDTWRYVRTDEARQVISREEPKLEDMIDPDTFIQSILTTKVSHYHGNTSEGLYNDDSGTAYNISFFDDGTTKTVYKGKFVDGEYSDTQDGSESWYITRERPDENGNGGTLYMYYKGRFVKGHPIEKSLRNSEDIFKPDIDETFADEQIAGEPFESEIIWDSSGFAT